jgi:hypothetical protein
MSSVGAVAEDVREKRGLSGTGLLGSCLLEKNIKGRSEGLWQGTLS